MATNNRLMATDQLMLLAQHEPIAQVCDETRQAIDELMWNRTLRNKDDEFLTFLRRSAGYATAAIDGAAMPDDPGREPDTSAMGMLAQHGLMVTAMADTLGNVFSNSPAQVWARLHSLISDADDRGTPRTADEIVDPLRLGNIPSGAEARERMRHLCEHLITSAAPAVLLSAIAHGEICVTQPFSYGSHLISRATARMVLAARKLDEKGVTAPEIGWYLQGRPSYVAALKQYQSGTIEGVTAFVKWHCEGIQRGIGATLQVLEAKS